MSDLCLFDLNSKNLILTRIPRVATATMKGSKLLEPIVPLVKYKRTAPNKALQKETIKAFNLN